MLFDYFFDLPFGEGEGGEGAGAVDATAVARHDFDELGDGLFGQGLEERLVLFVESLDVFVGVLVADGMNDGSLYAARLGEAAAVFGDVGGEFFLAAVGDVDVVGGHEGAEFFEAHDVVHLGNGVCLVAFGKAGTDEDDFGVGVFFLGVARGIDHGTAGFGDEGFEHGGVFFDPAGVGGTAGGGHERLAFVHFFFEFLGFVGGSDFGAEGYLDDIIETDLLDGCQHLPGGGVELPVDGGGGDGDDFLFGVGEGFMDVDDFGAFHDGSVGACLHTFAAVDALLFVDVFDPFGVFADGFDGARLFTGDGGVDDGVVGAYLLAEAATDAIDAADVGFAADEGDGVLGAVHDAGSSFAAAAEVGDRVLRLDAGAAGFVDDGEDVLAGVFVRHRHAGEFGEVDEVDFFVGNFVAEDGYDFVFEDVAVFVDAAAHGAFVAGTHFDGEVFEFGDEFVFFEELDDADEELALGEHGVVVV